MARRKGSLNLGYNPVPPLKPQIIRSSVENRENIEKLDDVVIAQAERIDQLELDVSRLESIVDALLNNAFRRYQGGGWQSSLDDNFADKFPDKWNQWLSDNDYAEGHGLIKIKDAPAELESRLKMLMENGRTEREAMMDAGVIGLKRLVDNNK